MIRRKEILKILIYALVLVFVLSLFEHSAGVFTFLLLGAALAAFILFVLELLRFFGVLRRRRSARYFYRVLLFTVVFMVALFLCESVLQVREYYVSEGHDVRGSAPGRLSLPEEWEARSTEVEGAEAAGYWHGVLHVYDENGMRRSRPFPPKKEDVFRIMVIGDSLTYGVGVAKDKIYPSLIEKHLSRTHRVEVLNLGICGYQSENLLWVVRTFTPRLEPDMIVYGMCMNDFLPSRVGEYRNNMAWPFPLPQGFKRFMEERTLTGKMLSKAYNSFLFKLGLRRDFYTDILKNFQGYQTKFYRDVSHMNLFVMKRGLPPVLAMVLNQLPETGTKSHRITLTAEEYMKKAGMRVISAERYYRRHEGEVWKVSKWEAHPSKKAHQVFAEQFVRELRKLPELRPYRRRSVAAGN